MRIKLKNPAKLGMFKSKEAVLQTKRQYRQKDKDNIDKKYDLKDKCYQILHAQNLIPFKI